LVLPIAAAFAAAAMCLLATRHTTGTQPTGGPAAAATQTAPASTS
jgi:hypothetical protein